MISYLLVVLAESSYTLPVQNDATLWGCLFRVPAFADLATTLLGVYRETVWLLPYVAVWSRHLDRA